MLSMIKRRSGLAALVLAGAVLGSALTGTVMAYQPHMQAALRAELNAVNQLQMALPDKAGHRVNAINLVNQAIAQTRAGIAAGAR
ncbi:MAG: hypothetical protein JO024_06400 [Candidatus Eremiobacteraeota bacterium]|nr:hypothetical protein [Candidatus Eremiobacteraeota bacterium]MBV9737198.1 hypothetical protein [Candidatus Eremiobacteraeota bacterium]